ncbi:hypothetical protein CEP54_004351 [Fusarium duplospermum]|uniref:Uncharacterized protein n=1 Tax=Fusarium duplospermum TaxID=1325734 RepID=A0A428QIN9_9HYPO|nr:hypothetical protein CEP54_004351 [Fusarium duplospermum]
MNSWRRDKILVCHPAIVTRMSALLDGYLLSLCLLRAKITEGRVRKTMRLFANNFACVVVRVYQTSSARLYELAEPCSCFESYALLTQSTRHAGPSPKGPTPLLSAMRSNPSKMC